MIIKEAMENLSGKASIKEVVNYLKSRYRNIKEDTISTSMSDLSVNGPPSSPYPMSQRFLIRIERGLYELNESKELHEPMKHGTIKTDLKSQEAMAESLVQENLKKWFVSKGYKVVEKCIDDPTKIEDIKECRSHSIFGIDIVAQKGHEKWIIEVKGETKGGSASGDVDFCTGLGQLLSIMKKFDEDIHYGIAVPHPSKNFRNIIGRFSNSEAIKKLGLNLFLVRRDGAVVHKSTEEFAVFAEELAAVKKGRYEKRSN